MAIIKLSIIERKKLSIFFTCIVLAVSAWLFFSLSQKYEYKVKTVITFTNLPNNKAFYPLQSDTVILDIEGTGWQLLFNKFKASSNHIQVDLAALEKQQFVTFKPQLKDINEQISFNQKVLQVHPETLFFDFAARKVKRIPIKFVSDIRYKKQFGQYKPIELKPSYVTVTGPTEQIKNIEYWQTDTFRKKNVDNTLSTQIYLKPVSEPNISIFPNVVEMNLPVDELTEKIIQVPLKVKNNPHYYQVKLIPEVVSLTILVALSDFASISSENFSATVDLSLWEKMGANKLPVNIKFENSFIKLQRIAPQQVDFMVIK
jgi:YbbR domain-containing protein